MSVGVMKDYKRKRRNLHASHTNSKVWFAQPGEKVKVDLSGQKGSIQWKDTYEVLVKQKQLGELP